EAALPYSARRLCPGAGRLPERQDRADRSETDPHHGRCERESGQGAGRLLRRSRHQIDHDPTQFLIMNHWKFLRSLMFAAAVVFGAVAARAEDLGAVKARMEQRIAAVDALKSRGVAGENNRGFLEARAGATAEDQKIISDDNSDRLAVYKALAQ